MKLRIWAYRAFGVAGLCLGVLVLAAGLGCLAAECSKAQGMGLVVILFWFAWSVLQFDPYDND